MVNDRFVPPDALINFQHLRLLAKDRINSDANTPLSPRERILLGHLLGSEPDRKAAVAFGRVLDHQLATLGQPRFSALWYLFDPHLGYLTTYHEQLIRVAHYLLDWEGARKREEAKFAWHLLKKRHPNLFKED